MEEKFLNVPIEKLRRFSYNVCFTVGMRIRLADGRIFEIVRLKISDAGNGYSLQYVSRTFEHRSEDYLLEHGREIL